jgi:predicted DNA-binding WGR domain protein
VNARRGLNFPLSTLFGDGTLVTEWGRIGSPGKVMRRAFQTEELAQTALIKRIQAKTRRGYLPIAVGTSIAEGPPHRSRRA